MEGYARGKLGRTAGALALVLVVAAPAPGQLAVAFSHGDGTAAVATLRSRSPWTRRAGGTGGGSNLVLAAAGRHRLLVLSRDAGTLAVVALKGWRVQHRLTVPGAEDVVAGAGCTAWVTRRGSARLLRVDTCTGTAVEATDLAAFAADDGDPDLGAMAIDRGRLFVQIRRQNADIVSRLAPPAYLAVVDVRSGALIDVDPQLPGAQAITLVGTAPNRTCSPSP
jgi:hypothetical protein